eukprot:2606870-Rhodomonas_salina.3
MAVCSTDLAYVAGNEWYWHSVCTYGMSGSERAYVPSQLQRAVEEQRDAHLKSQVPYPPTRALRHVRTSVAYAAHPPYAMSGTGVAYTAPCDVRD